MDVVIDSREQKRIKLAKEYYTKQGHEVQVKELKTGDYLFENKVVFEFKTMQDFISSILNGRVFNEAIEQCYNYKYQFIIIHGSNRDRQQAIKEYTDLVNVPGIGEILAKQIIRQINQMG